MIGIATNIWFWVDLHRVRARDVGARPRRLPSEVARRAAEGSGDLGDRLGRARAAFAGGLYFFFGHHAALTFLTGYVIEESLSIDNIFVIVLIFEYFTVPAICQHRVLFYGILGALVMRGLFIGARRGADRALPLDDLHLRRDADRHRRSHGAQAGRGVRRRAESGRAGGAAGHPAERRTFTASTSSPSRTAGAWRRRCFSCSCSSR